MSWYWKTLMGDNHYQRYVEHHERVHPGAPVMSERAYWRHRHAEADANPSARCC
ncbi:YbdD/YjiX family protein [Mycobacterium sp. SMC-4]|uniref:YbdD/YjiX family protein n=1 Tax=Mycobacterium sp. SMC-4 TaxID=2857059 RepID=UPI003D003D13